MYRQTERQTDKVLQSTVLSDPQLEAHCCAQTQTHVYRQTDRQTASVTSVVSQVASSVTSTTARFSEVYFEGEVQCHTCRRS